MGMVKDQLLGCESMTGPCEICSSYDDDSSLIEFGHTTVHTKCLDACMSEAEQSTVRQETESLDWFFAMREFGIEEANRMFP